MIVGFWGWDHINHPIGNQLTGDRVGQILALGRLAGLFAAFGALLQILLSSRIRWLDRAFGFDRLTRFHHIVGFSLAVTLVAHPVLVLAGHAAQAGVSLPEQEVDFLRNWEDVAAAAIGLVLMMAALIFSVAVVLTRINYELWHATHMVLYLAVAIAFGHQLAVGMDFTLGNAWFKYYWVGLYVFVVLNLVIYRIAIPFLAFYRHRFAVAAVSPETADVNSVYIEGRRLDSFHMSAGQFLIVRFMAKGFHWEAHPFSLSRLPDGKTLRLTIKALGDFTRRIPGIKPGTPVVVEGPLGVFTSDRCLSEKVLMIAGGIGITPIRSLVEEMAGRGKDMVVLYGNRHHSAVVFEKELNDLAAANRGLRIVPVMSADPEWPGERGTIDQGLISRLVPDVRDRDVYLCGPPPMMRKIRRGLTSLGVPVSRIHWERFAL